MFNHPTMQKVIICKGLIASGKSTWAKEFIAKNPQYKRVNKDDLRAMVDNGKHSKARETLICQLRDVFIWECLRNGYSVVVDDTNFYQKHVDDITNLVTLFNGSPASNGKVEVEVKYFDIEVEEAIKRDAAREKPVGEGPIRSMYQQHVLPQKYPKVTQNPALQSAVIFDIDGTLAKMNGRSPFDHTRVGEDLPNLPIVLLSQTFAHDNDKIICFSGRSEDCRVETEKWLKDNGVWYSELHMRPSGNVERDDLIKRRLLEQIIKRYYIRMSIDDRDRVVSMFRASGITCLQVDYGNF